MTPPKRPSTLTVLVLASASGCCEAPLVGERATITESAAFVQYELRVPTGRENRLSPVFPSAFWAQALGKANHSLNAIQDGDYKATERIVVRFLDENHRLIGSRHVSFSTKTNLVHFDEMPCSPPGRRGAEGYYRAEQSDLADASLLYLTAKLHSGGKRNRR